MTLQQKEKIKQAGEQFHERFFKRIKSLKIVKPNLKPIKKIETNK